MYGGTNVTMPDPDPAANARFMLKLGGAYAKAATAATGDWVDNIVVEADAVVPAVAASPAARVAVILGFGSAVGASILTGLTAAGYSVAICARTLSKLESAAGGYHCHCHYAGAVGTHHCIGTVNVYCFACRFSERQSLVGVPIVCE